MVMEYLSAQVTSEAKLLALRSMTIVGSFESEKAAMA